MPRTADGARACERTGGGEVAGSAKLRADTSEIVSCVARYCPEDDPEVTRRRRTEASKAGDGCTKEIDAPDMQGGGCGGSGAEAESDTSVVSKVELLELPLIPDAFAGVGYSAVEQHGEMRLRQIVQMHEAWLPTQGENILVWDLDAELSPAVEKFCSVSETQGCSEVAALLRPQRELRRIQCDWSETKSGDKFLFNESCNLLRKVIKSNTRMLLSRKDIIVPNAFENDYWGQALNDVLLSPSTTKGGGEMHQLLLPIDLVREDEEKIKGAPSKLVSTASSYWLRFKETNVSLLKAAMRVPCVWNHAHAIDGLAKIATKEMTTMATQLKPGPTPCPTALHVQPAQMTSEKEVHQNAITKDSTVTLRNPLPGDECDGNVPQVDNPQLFTKVVINADDSPLSTDYFLSDKFLRCDWSDLSDDASGTHNTNSSDDQEALDYRQLLEQLARPVLWDLMRKKVIQVDKASFQRALNCISLEKLEAIIYQQFLNVRKMSENPSAVSSVEIFEACSNLRQAVWLHTLR
ncbi:unnamed protein product [Phytophthora lilii]|uniref:Unnamed protein product n=1 Tax=Phytophthora lilii TaxID=2077276 RepID=A0A9W6YLF5_9STRA|nr:unnamed protein product [Phytophthora lilii]